MIIRTRILLSNPTDLVIDWQDSLQSPEGGNRLYSRRGLQTSSGRASNVSPRTPSARGWRCSEWNQKSGKWCAMTPRKSTIGLNGEGYYDRDSRLEVYIVLLRYQIPPNSAALVQLSFLFIPEIIVTGNSLSACSVPGESEIERAVAVTSIEP